VDIATSEKWETRK